MVNPSNKRAPLVKKITLKSSDGEKFMVDEMVAMEFQAIRHMIKDDCEESGIPLPNVTSKILSKVIEYCQKHVNAAEASSAAATAATGLTNTAYGYDQELNQWDRDFVKVDHATLFDLIRAADNLKITGLLDLTCQTVADMIKGKSPQEIRKIFNIKNEITPEEEEELRRENQWAFE